MARWLLRIAVAASVLLVGSHLAYSVTAYHELTLQAVQFAELGFPLLFAAFLNGVVWSLDAPPRRARLTAHATNACMLAIAMLVAWLAPVTPAYLVLLCSGLLSLAGVVNHLRASPAAPSSGMAPA
jgi:hypothetical protein